MSRTPDWLRKRICDYYRETTEASYLKTWAGSSLGFHMGLDHVEGRALDESLTETNRYLADQAGVEPDMSVLDAGCGVGGSAFYLAQVRAARVVGITLEPRQVVIARHFMRQFGLQDRVRFEEGDFTDAPFPEASFDVVWHVESLCYVFDLDGYLARVRRLLRPGGKLACVDVFRGEHGDPSHHQALAAGCALPMLRSQLEVVEAVRRAGFDSVQQRDLTPRVLVCAAVLGRMAALRLAMLRVEAILTTKSAPIYEEHARGGLGAARGFHSGAVTYGYVGARRAGTRELDSAVAVS